jgi:hypothetical protein
MPLTEVENPHQASITCIFKSMCRSSPCAPPKRATAKRRSRQTTTHSSSSECRRVSAQQSGKAYVASEDIVGLLLNYKLDVLRGLPRQLVALAPQRQAQHSCEPIQPPRHLYLLRQQRSPWSLPDHSGAQRPGP